MGKQDRSGGAPKQAAPPAKPEPVVTAAPELPLEGCALHKATCPTGLVHCTVRQGLLRHDGRRYQTGECGDFPAAVVERLSTILSPVE